MENQTNQLKVKSLEVFSQQNQRNQKAQEANTPFRNQLIKRSLKFIETKHETVYKPQLCLVNPLEKLRARQLKKTTPNFVQTTPF